ncbi:uncharacterized membrane-anchored protein YjiN (DUF445 family) [Paenibacillus phyllosphaerae]|uniref:Uncharacterized membrane-anchored protein YjiN (DUF445 family) n=1 Tax=Paenibacillus phyllosphaerae TaxID=274593 RepID=A0A7W5FRW1_9BACL|nr:DUF445 domain-containing protein [Paenibacillus phyllosphaerae]MBB3114717.1 uncharacterized membrane-anchored protein YjiN (DUF445 family) [Paenibacillus phyllosphaerae]
MKKANVKRYADSALTLSFIGTLAAFPFQHTFLGGLCFSGLSAATIGGLADTFAVSALFRQPLGIPWPRFMGTRIIARNRDRLINEIVHMVQHELLSLPSIQKKLDSYDVAVMLQTYLIKHGGQADVSLLLRRFASEVLEGADLGELARTVQRFVLDHARAFEASDLLADIGEWTISNGYDDKVIDFLIKEAIRLVKTNELRSAMEQLIASALESYEQGRNNRKFVNAVAGINPGSMSHVVQMKLALALQQLLRPDNPRRLRLKAWIVDYVERLRTDEETRQRVETMKDQLIELTREHLDLGVMLEEWLHNLKPTEQSDGIVSRITSWLERTIGGVVNRLSTDQTALQGLDRMVKQAAMRGIERKHDAIGKLVRDGLQQFSEDELIRFVHDKAGHDLQFIRLNGTLVGGLIGVVLYLATFWIGR